MRQSILALLALGLGGCASTASAACKRADECNNLSGVSVSECGQNVQKALDNLSSGQRSDCLKQIETCLDNSSCTDVTNCEKSIKNYCPGVPVLHGKD